MEVRRVSLSHMSIFEVFAIELQILLILSFIVVNVYYYIIWLLLYFAGQWCICQKSDHFTMRWRLSLGSDFLLSIIYVLYLVVKYFFVIFLSSIMFCTSCNLLQCCNVMLPPPPQQMSCDDWHLIGLNCNFNIYSWWSQLHLIWAQFSLLD